MNRIVRHVEKERLLLIQGLVDGVLRLKSDCFGQEGVCLVVFFQPGYGSFFVLDSVSHNHPPHNNFRAFQMNNQLY